MASEKRLIDANALKESVMKEIRHYWNEGEGGYYLAEDVIPDIDLAPTVDAVEVVRCKDCKWCRYSKVHDVQWCDHESGLCDAIVGNEFCSYGERKENEQT